MSSPRNPPAPPALAELLLAETPIRHALGAGDLAAAASLVLELYGYGVLRLLTGRLDEASAAQTAYASFTRQLPARLERCDPARQTVRSWVYALARRISDRHEQRQASGRPGRPTVSTRARSRDADGHTRSTVKARRVEPAQAVRQLRKSLPADDQLLLILRVDRGLSFPELAQVLLVDDRPLEGHALEHGAAEMKKRFVRTTHRLRKMAVEAGVLQRARARSR